MAADGLRTALDLYEVGEGMMRQRLRRLHGDERVVETALREWQRARPGAEHGDSSGRPSTRFDQTDG